MNIHAAQPETICAKLVLELASLAEKGIPDEFTLARIESGAKATKDADPRHFLYVMGAIAALRGDVDAVRKHFESCIEIHGMDAITAYNYASALLGTGHSVLAYAQARKGVTAFPMDDDLRELLSDVTARMTAEMWDDMDHDSEEDLTRMCMINFAAGDD